MSAGGISSTVRVFRRAKTGDRGVCGGRRVVVLVKLFGQVQRQSCLCTVLVGRVFFVAVKIVTIRVFSVLDNRMSAIAERDEQIARG